MARSAPKGPNSHPGNEIDRSSNQQPDNRGIELDEQRPYGQNSGWAPQSVNPEPLSKDPDGEQDEPIHLGRTQSTTNSQ